MIAGRRLSAVAAGLLLPALWVVLASIVVVGLAPSDFHRIQEAAATLPARLVACIVAWAAIHHTVVGSGHALAGVGRGPRARGLPVLTLGDADPPTDLQAAVDDPPVAIVGARDAADDFVVGLTWFVTWALVIPVWAILLRPWLVEGIW